MRLLQAHVGLTFLFSIFIALLGGMLNKSPSGRHFVPKPSPGGDGISSTSPPDSTTTTAATTTSFLDNVSTTVGPPEVVSCAAPNEYECFFDYGRSGRFYSHLGQRLEYDEDYGYYSWELRNVSASTPGAIVEKPGNVSGAPLNRVWPLEHYVNFSQTSHELVNSARFGMAVALSGDGNVAIIGAPGMIVEVGGQNVSRVGFVQAYRAVESPTGQNGVFWEKMGEKIWGDIFEDTFSSIPGGYVGSAFGSSVAANEDGTVLVVSAISRISRPDIIDPYAGRRRMQTSSSPTADPADNTGSTMTPFFFGSSTTTTTSPRPSFPTGYVEVWTYDGVENVAWRRKGNRIDVAEYLGNASTTVFGFLSVSGLGVKVNSAGTRVAITHFDPQDSSLSGVFVFEYSEALDRWQQLGGVLPPRDEVQSGDLVASRLDMDDAGSRLVFSNAPPVSFITQPPRIYAYEWVGSAENGAWLDISQGLDAESLLFSYTGYLADGNRSSAHQSLLTESLLANMTAAQLGEVISLYGNDVSISGNGQRLAIGAPLFSARGEVFTFEWRQERWEQLDTREAQGEYFYNFFGQSVALDFTGERMAVSTQNLPLHYFFLGQEIEPEILRLDNLESIIDLHDGEVSLFQWDADGQTWRTLGAAITSTVMLERNGADLALSSDGSRLMMASPGVNFQLILDVPNIYKIYTLLFNYMSVGVIDNDLFILPFGHADVYSLPPSNKECIGCSDTSCLPGFVASMPADVPVCIKEDVSDLATLCSYYQDSSFAEEDMLLADFRPSVWNPLGNEIAPPANLSSLDEVLQSFGALAQVKRTQTWGEQVAISGDGQTTAVAGARHVGVYHLSDRYEWLPSSVQAPSTGNGSSFLMNSNFADRSDDDPHEMRFFTLDLDFSGSVLITGSAPNLKIFEQQMFLSYNFANYDFAESLLGNSRIRIFQRGSDDTWRLAFDQGVLALLNMTDLAPEMYTNASKLVKLDVSLATTGDRAVISIVYYDEVAENNTIDNTVFRGEIVTLCQEECSSAAEGATDPVCGWRVCASSPVHALHSTSHPSHLVFFPPDSNNTSEEEQLQMQYFNPRLRAQGNCLVLTEYIGFDVAIRVFRWQDPGTGNTTLGSWDDSETLWLHPLNVTEGFAESYSDMTIDEECSTMALSFLPINPTRDDVAVVLELTTFDDNNSSGTAPPTTGNFYWTTVQELTPADFADSVDGAPALTLPLFLLRLVLSGSGNVLVASVNEYLYHALSEIYINKNESVPPNNWKYGYVRAFARNETGRPFQPFGQVLVGRKPMHVLGYSLDLDASGRYLATGNPDLGCFYMRTNFCNETSYPGAQVFDSAIATCSSKPKKFNSINATQLEFY